MDQVTLTNFFEALNENQVHLLFHWEEWPVMCPGVI